MCQTENSVDSIMYGSGLLIISFTHKFVQCKSAFLDFKTLKYFESNFRESDITVITDIVLES